MNSDDKTSEPKTILVVDDEVVTTDLAKTFLERHGFNVVLAHDGEQALEVADKEEPDLILLDVMLPKKDGFEVCRTLKSQAKFKNIPILMFTAKGLSRDVEMGQEAGADEYIIKPFSGKALVATIRKHLGMS
ncbi:MAG: response regulator [Candidatus Thorarchaeota archaeon]